MKNKRLFLPALLLFSIILPSSCGEDPLKYSYSLDISKFNDYKENEYCRTNIQSLNDNNYPYLAQVKSLTAYNKNPDGTYIPADESIYPFDTNLIYVRYAKEKLESTETINTIENILGEYTYQTHCLFDRHYYYFDENKNLINNLKVINDSYGTNTWLDIDKRLYEVLLEAKELTKFSNGKFNLFVGELSDKWDYYITYNNIFSSDYTNSIDPEQNEDTKLEIATLLNNTPQKEEIDNVLELKFTENSYQVRFNKYKNAEKVSITLGGIGKGYLTENLYQSYKKNNLTYGMLTAGSSSMVFFGDRVFKDNWYIGLSNPYGVYYNTLGTLKLENTKYSTSTSGAQVNYYYALVNNKIVLRNHIIDPTTGYPNDYYNQILLISKTIPSTKMDALSTVLVNCSFEEIQNYITKIRSTYGDLEFVFSKKKTPDQEELVDVYLSKGLQNNNIFQKNNPDDCKVNYHNLNY